MGWTGFAIKMEDQKHFSFGTTLLTEFFQMPEGYSVDDIDKVINHSYVLQDGELRSYKDGGNTRPEGYKDAVVHRDRPFVECYLDKL